MTSEQKKISKLRVTLRQWQEILDKQMDMCANLRNEEVAAQAFSMILKLEGMIKELEA